MDKVYITKEGHEKLLADLEQLKGPRRREIAKQLDYARSFGDLRENAEYEAAKHALNLNEIRIQELEQKLSRVEIITIDSSKSDKIIIGTKVKLWDLKYEEEVLYELTGSEEADPSAGKISVESPVGTALIGHGVGDTIEIQVPRGILQYEVRELS